MTRIAEFFRNLSIQWKVVTIILGVSAISLSLVGIGLLVHTRVTYEHQMREKLKLLAVVIGENSTAALTFNDAAAATETLAALRADEHVTAGGLYDEGGVLFAYYVRDKDSMPLPKLAPTGDVWKIDGNHAWIVRDIIFKDRSVGKVYIIADTGEWKSTLWSFVLLILLLGLAVLTIGFFVSVWLQRLVTSPITDLEQVMRRVGQERDFSLRAVKRGKDELGTLVDGFNDMVDEIAKGRVEIDIAHEELRRLNEDLERRVRERTAQLEIANKELESFSYSVSHDLRAPLRAIDGFSSIILDDYADRLDETGRDHLRRIRRGAQRMAMLIDDLLHLARVTRAEPSREQVDITALVRDILDDLCRQDKARHVEVMVDGGLTANGDSRLLRIVLENLLGNAWKFTGGRPDARIEIGKDTDNGESIYFVRDNGAGFDMAHAEKLFAPFQRLHSNDEFPGTGIGLATVQRVVEKHGGRIWAEAAVNQGAVFYFTLS